MAFNRKADGSVGAGFDLFEDLLRQVCPVDGFHRSPALDDHSN